MTDVFTLRGPIKKDRPEPAKRSVTRKSLDGTELGSVDLGVRAQLSEIERGFFDRPGTRTAGHMSTNNSQEETA